jgi:hypothetical protein
MKACIGPAVWQITALAAGIAAYPHPGVAYDPRVPRQGLRQVRFSPDGRYVLAQDDFDIDVLTVSPLAIVFRIFSGDVSDAQFTSDSQNIVFISSGVHRERSVLGRTLLTRTDPYIDRWSIADRARVAHTKIGVCGSSELSPDGRTLACNDFEGNLRLIDTAAGQTIFEKSRFVKAIPGISFQPGGSVQTVYNGDPAVAALEFSPDGSYLLAVPTGGDGKELGYDLRTRGVIKIPSAAQKPEFHQRVFVSPSRVLLLDPLYPLKHGMVNAKVVEFPSGRVISKLQVPPGLLSRAADPGYILLHKRWLTPDDPNANWGAAVELDSGDVLTVDTHIVDVFGRFYVAQRLDGAVGLYERGKGLQATVVLRGTLGALSRMPPPPGP